MIRNLSLIIILLLAGCATQTIDPVVQDAPPVAIPPVTPMTMNPVQWKVMNLADLQALQTQLKNNKTDVVIFTLDSNNFQNLNLNFVEIQRYLTQQKAVIVLLKKIVDQQTGQNTKKTQNKMDNNSNHVLKLPSNYKAK